jgi:hypothetical protein
MYQFKMASGKRGAVDQQLLGELAGAGLASAPELTRRLGLTQPTFSRLVTRLGDRLLAIGKARARRYAARRQITDIGDRIPIYEIDEAARARHIATLHALLPEAWYVEALGDEVESAFYPDWPYFLNELRPSGFLGRLVPEQHPELGAPSDVRSWSGTHVLRYAARFGWNLPGALILGEEAFRQYLANAAAPPDRIAPKDRARRYPKLAEGALANTPGSSAGGEQPKFLVSRADGRVPMLVKFSPPMRDAVGRRSADLLVAEHLAHVVLEQSGMSAPRSSLLVAGGRTFLEVERFDRTAVGGRRGVLSLMTLDAEFVGSLRTWGDSVARLAAAGVVETREVLPVRRLELFGRLIGNTDMHGGNLSFFARGSRVQGLAPAYDMLPMRYAPQAGNLVKRPLELAPPLPADAPVWDDASSAALEFWRRVTRGPELSAEFRRIASANLDAVAAWRRVAALLPS